MDSKIVFNLGPSENNARNSEGSFLRAPNGDILFAFSHFDNDCTDHASCNIAIIRSSDEGESWTDPEMLVSAKDFGTSNLMSVSGLQLKDGSLCFFFVIKETDGSTTIGRTISKDGYNFKSERCPVNCSNDYYVINNDRFIRTKDGRIVAPAARHGVCHNHDGEYYRLGPARACCFVSYDDGATFTSTHIYASLNYSANKGNGLQEPGIIELDNGDFWLWGRTDLGCQYQFWADSSISRFTPPEPTRFTSPCSPMSVYKVDDAYYAIYNPIPNYNGRNASSASAGRTPIVITKSTDGMKTWGDLVVLDDDPDSGYCYASLFKTNDNHLLISYCMGNTDDKFCLNRLGIRKININDI